MKASIPSIAASPEIPTRRRSTAGSAASWRSSPHGRVLTVDGDNGAVLPLAGSSDPSPMSDYLLLLRVRVECDVLRLGQMRLTHDLKARLAHRVQLTTDGHRPYLSAVEDAFGSEVD